MAGIYPAQFGEADMTASRIQLRGNCPCCGNDQAVVKGVMSKHGYTVDNGWFNGVCSGDVHEPIQVSRVHADRVIESVRLSVARIEDELTSVEAGKVVPKTISLGYGKGRHEIAFADADQFQQKNAVDTLKRGLKYKASQGTFFADHLARVVEKNHGQPLREIKLEEVGVRVGSVVKVRGAVVTVTKIEFLTARGVGPSINGQWIEHIHYEHNGKELVHPKRFARLV